MTPQMLAGEFMHGLGMETATEGVLDAPGAHVLVVDDENGPRQALRMLLKEDYRVHVAQSVDDALTILSDTPVELIITDIRMPKKTGVDLLREAKDQHPDIQVIMLTGYGQLETAVKAMEFGAFAYMEKPFDNDAMLDMVRVGLDKHRSERNRRALEYLALEANRFETLGRVVSGTLHDFGSPLTVLSSNLEILRSNPQREDIANRLETMEAQVQHCNDMVRSTMNFLRHESEEYSFTGINAVVDSCLDVAQPVLRGARVDLDLDLDAANYQIRGDRVLLRQALLNLINNACQAMEHVEGVHQLRIATSLEGNQVCLEVRDNGPGIPDELHESVFDTFFTTKGKDGTGLGLAVVKNVMRRHEGQVELDTTVEQGARFVLRFPVMGEGAQG